MLEMTLAEIASAVKGNLLQGDGQQVVREVSTDTRKITPGSLFVALRGERFDAHDFLEQAVEKGAGALLVSAARELKPASQNSVQSSWQGLGAEIPVIQVEDTLNALQQLACYNRQKSGIPVVAVTGSVGKTSTKDMIAAVLEQKFRVLKTSGNFNNEIGLPLTLLQLAAGHEVAVVEMGMRGLGEIAALAEIARPDIGVITNIGETHIELLGSVDNIARAKGELLDSLPSGGTAILNGD
ncbi:MAG TPA: UDP-N-acetylmuramoyl-tripeptide--D-alanyl-D-alanine ligase, partial [Bacillota bacterium]|nr:UDP-N-acetylmuramoyl-tripeptide--D-alanyl-D-alanine ligase [Bacillota bacterium]